MLLNWTSHALGIFESYIKSNICLATCLMLFIVRLRHAAINSAPFSLSSSRHFLHTQQQQ